jgi:glycosyltransferase involved in cell wall biosynthesis
MAPKADSLVSVILPTYNRAGLLPRSVRSVLNQTYPNFELIIVDDCSTDNTKAVVGGFRDKRIKYLRQVVNRGATASRNAGIKAAVGQYVAFQDSDDEWLPGKLKKQIEAFEFGSPDLGVVFTSFWLIDNGFKTYYPQFFSKQTNGELHYELLKTNFIGTPASVVKKSCFDRAGLFGNIPRLQDWELWLRISRFYSFKHIDEPLLNAYRCSDSISRNRRALITARKYILKKYFTDISRKPKVQSQHYFDIGTLLCLDGRVNEGRRYLLEAMRLNQTDHKLPLSFLVSILGKNVYKKVAASYLNTKGLTL